MATILSKQKSLYKNTLVYLGIGLPLLLIGYFTVQKYLIPGLIILVISAWFIMQGSNSLKGSFGESKVTEILSKLPDNYYIFNDLVVEGSQNDHILICPKGIYTIETKNWRGKIYGNSKDKNWSIVTKDRSGKSRKYVKYSPVMQGKKHSLNLSKYLQKHELGNCFVKTIIVFTHPETQLKVYSPDVPVLYSNQLQEYIDKQKDCLNNETCKKVVDSLQGRFSKDK